MPGGGNNVNRGCSLCCVGEPGLLSRAYMAVLVALVLLGWFMGGTSPVSSAVWGLCPGPVVVMVVINGDDGTVASALPFVCVLSQAAPLFCICGRWLREVSILSSPKT